MIIKINKDRFLPWVKWTDTFYLKNEYIDRHILTGRCHFYNQQKYSGCIFVKNVWLDVYLTTKWNLLSWLHRTLALLHPLFLSTGEKTSKLSKIHPFYARDLVILVNYPNEWLYESYLSNILPAMETCAFTEVLKYHWHRQGTGFIHSSG